MAQRRGRYTVVLDNPPSIRAAATVGCKKESEGPLGGMFDIINKDSYFGQASWEKAESQMQSLAVSKALEKAGLQNTDIDFIFAGDLLNQCIGSTYGLRELGIPYVGLFGACSTMAESLCVASTFIEGGVAQKVVACTSSHFCTAERQFRFPLEYGGQRTPTAQWTATASGAAVLQNGDVPPFVRAITVGTIEDLGKVGSSLLADLLRRDGIDLGDRQSDCGLLLYDLEKQDVHAGGSGCGCSASVLCGHLLPQMREGTLHNILFIATGALMSPTVVQQGESIASIAHLGCLSTQKSGGVF